MSRVVVTRNPETWSYRLFFYWLSVAAWHPYIGMLIDEGYDFVKYQRLIWRRDEKSLASFIEEEEKYGRFESCYDETLGLIYDSFH